MERDDDARLEEITAYARDFAEEAVDALRDVMNDTDEKGAARAAAAKTMLERGFGMPTRRVEQKHEHTIVDQRRAHFDALKILAERNKPKQLTIIEDAEYKEVG